MTVRICGGIPSTRYSLSRKIYSATHMYPSSAQDSLREYTGLEYKQTSTRPRRGPSPATDLRFDLAADPRTSPGRLLPLIDKLLPVNDDQSVDLAFAISPRRNAVFPERRRAQDDTFVVGGDSRSASSWNGRSLP